ncbi:hypothetical protein GJ744_004860 [Endocarpon pusillum]|uniref:Wings apart-like protein C-terminal domain-containing protein n=1 Tax=Endocarpon pusillum TaxID=364733 RepID=A0A8H7AUD7_9EURO|nr:hypothetical protein GJ744_004860 [Endocarpon pusillum]
MPSQDSKPRRKALVYGKARRSAPAYNVFDLDHALREDVHSRISSEKDEILVGQGQIQGQVVKSIETTPKGKLSNFRQRSEKQLPAILPTQKDSGSKTTEEGRPSTFDLSLSEEEDSNILFHKSMQKRRRLTPVRNQGRGVKSHRKELGCSGTNEDSTQYPRDTNGPANSLLRAQATSQSRLARQSPRRMRTPAPEDGGSVSPTSPYSTPRQTRLLSSLINPAEPTDSPSKLPLTSLSLANAEDLKPKPADILSRPSRKTEQIKKGLLRPRKRLIDAMVSPQKRLSSQASGGSDSDDSVLDARNSFRQMDDTRYEVDLVATVHAKGEKSVEETRGITQNISSTSLGVGAKPRATYSRERSHLADMVTDDLLDPISQPALRGDGLLMSQNGAIFSSFPSAISQEGSDEEQEQDIVGIRSIHELRHSGGNARSQIDIESILEDIEAKGPSSRARRLRGLAQLTKRLANPEVGRHVFDQSLDQRLCSCLCLDGNVVFQTLLIMILSRLMTSLQLSIASLGRIFEALIRSGTPLLEEPRDWVSVVQDRKQNLPKASCREMTAVVEPFRTSPVWSDRRPKSVSPQLVLIRSVDIVLRQVRQLGDSSVNLPAPFFDRLVQLLLQICPIQLIDAKENDSVLVMECIVSIIESLTISKDWAEEGCLEVAKKLSGLGPLLSQLNVPSAEASHRTQHLVLRLILNITNNDSDLCDSFCEPALLVAIFGIVERDFLQASSLAKAVLKDIQLEGVILALGALINLAEHSSSFRQAMLDCSVDGKSMVDWIAFAFRDQVDIASEASSVEQTMSLVAFGYLAVLLCNVCMDAQSRERVRGILKGATLEPLLQFVQEFLDHFRRAETLESGQEEDEPSMKSGFVDRFEGILAALRQSEGSQ